MTRLELGARLGATLDIDLCQACRAIWFDQYEDLRMAPAATLKVFGIISKQAKGAATPLTGALRCPGRDRDNYPRNEQDRKAARIFDIDQRLSGRGGP